MSPSRLTLVGIFIIFTPFTFADDCTSDYVLHNQNVLELVSSQDKVKQALGSAQRDCLALDLQDATSICPVFRNFEKHFLSLSETEQIVEGQSCFKKLVSLADSHLRSGS